MSYLDFEISHYLNVVNDGILGSVACFNAKTIQFPLIDSNDKCIFRLKTAAIVLSPALFAGQGGNQFQH